MTKLTGITWNHTRGLLPMVATAQRFTERHPDVEIFWQKRSLQEFADQPIQKLAETFDLLVIDHPFVGYAASHPVLLPLNKHLPADFLADQAAHSVGQSHPSYNFGGHQWALAIDAATPVAAWRPDLLDMPPQTWSELLALARQGRVAVPGVGVDCLMHAMMLCQSAAVTEAALVQLRELYSSCPASCFDWNPIQVLEGLSNTDAFVYCPFAYGYSNYARQGYALNRLQFGDVVDGICTTLGGTGLAISQRCRHLPEALDYVRYVASAECQRTLFWQSGGQPGHRAAWLDAEANRATHNFFRDTLPALDRAYVRPRYDGYLHFQDWAGPVVRDYLMKGGDARAVAQQVKLMFGGTSAASPLPPKGSPSGRTRRSSSLQTTEPPKRKWPAHPAPLVTDGRAPLVFVTMCVAKRRSLLANAAAHDLIRAAWKNASGWLVGRYVLMPDHLHLFCAPRDEQYSLQQWMSFWRSHVTRYWPQEGDKPIWQKEYWDTKLRRDESYMAKWEYVRTNPVRANLVSNPDDWPFQGEISELIW